MEEDASPSDVLADCFLDFEGMWLIDNVSTLISKEDFVEAWQRSGSR